MKLSDAIALGRTLLRPCSPATRRSPDDGCALDMAVKAINGSFIVNGKRYDEFQLWHAAPQYWPWLLEPNPNPVIWKQGEIFQMSIAFKFDRDVMGYNRQAPTMSLDAFIDWVRSVEPAEPEEVAAPASEEHAHVCTAKS